MNINIECEDDNYYDNFTEEISPRTNYGDGFGNIKINDINKKIEQLHLDVIKKEYFDSFDEGGHTQMDYAKAASKSAEITEQVAIKFGYFLANSNWKDNGYKYGKSTEQLYRKFLKKENESID